MAARRTIAGKGGGAALLVVLAGLAAGGAQAGNMTLAENTTAKMRFWNQTGQEIDELYMAPAGTDDWGPNQCLNDDDKSVESDERLMLEGIEPGQYDVKFHDVKGRSCLVRNVAVKGGGKYAFAIEERELAPSDCTK